MKLRSYLLHPHFNLTKKLTEYSCCKTNKQMRECLIKMNALISRWTKTILMTNVLFHWDFWCKKSHKQHNKCLQVQYNRNWVKYHACVTRSGIHSRIQCKKKSKWGIGESSRHPLSGYIPRPLSRKVFLASGQRWFEAKITVFQMFHKLFPDVYHSGSFYIALSSGSAVSAPSRFSCLLHFYTTLLHT